MCVDMHGDPFLISTGGSVNGRRSIDLARLRRAKSMDRFLSLKQSMDRRSLDLPILYRPGVDKLGAWSSTPQPTYRRSIDLADP